MLVKQEKLNFKIWRTIVMSFVIARYKIKYREAMKINNTEFTA